MRLACFWVVATLAVSWVVGCHSADDPEVIALRNRYLLTREPSGATGILERRERMLQAAGATAEAPSDAAAAQSATAETGAATQGPTVPEPVVLVGRIGGGASPTWESGRASFVMIDPLVEQAAGHEHGGAGHDDNCPFCKAAKQGTGDASAFVQVVDDGGNVVPIDARKLLAVAEGQLVVVQGTGVIDELGNLVVSATGVYPRR